MPAHINIMLADDHSLFSSGIQSILEKDSSIRVIGTATNGRELLDLLIDQQPHVVLVDINMPIMNGLEATRLIREQYPHVQVIILSGYNDGHLVAQAIHCGAGSYLLKDATPEEMRKTIHLVHAGQVCFPFMNNVPVNNYETDNAFLKQFHLTRREKEILQLISRQHTNQQIANHLHLSIYTIETHRKNIMKKLQLKTPAALMKFMLIHG